MKNQSGLADGYIHGFTKEEQERLFKQARVHEDIIFSQIDFSRCPKILEIGSGVGAQTQILLERYPQSQIHCIDASEAQIKTAKNALSKDIQSGRVRIDQADALHLPAKDQEYDGAFICWLLEHVQNPVDILAEARRALKPGGVIYCNEVLNATFYLDPYSPSTMKFWMEFNDRQWTLKGDPFVGGKLANYLLKAGYKNVSTKILTHHYDNRTPEKRAQFIDYWTHLLLSGAPDLIRDGRVDTATVDKMKAELEALKNDPNAVIFYSWVLARAER